MSVIEAWAALGLDPSATTPDQARARFRQLILTNHPDGQPPERQARANDYTRVIVEAYTVLRNQGFRRPVGPQLRGAAARRFDSAAPADVVAWADDLWREFAAGKPVVAWPMFDPFFPFHVWLAGWARAAGRQRRGR